MSYTELGLALVAFNALTAIFQTPAGFLVDRIGARIVLICGLLLGSAAVAVAGIVASFWVFVAMFALAGLGNAVYHPADYAMLSHRVANERMGRAAEFRVLRAVRLHEWRPDHLLGRRAHRRARHPARGG